MSGLIGFFRSFVGTTPSSSLVAATEANETQQGNHIGNDEYLTECLASNENKDNNDEYRLSLSSILSSTATTGTREQECQQLQHEYENEGRDEVNENHAVQDSEEELRNLLPYKVWKDARNEIIADYMSKRMAAPDEDEEEEEEENKKNPRDNSVNGKDDERNQNNDEQAATNEQEDDGVPDNDAIDVPFWDSQPPPSPDKEHQASKSTDEEKKMEMNNMEDSKDSADNDLIPKVPHVNDTTHTCTSIHTIDLHAKEIEFDLLRVEKIWGLRRTGRRNWMDRDYRRRNRTATTLELLKSDCNGGIDDEDQEDHSTDQVLPLVPFKEFEEDGPLGTLCKQVISMEVTQLVLPTQKTLQQKASAAFSVGYDDDGGQQQQQQQVEKEHDSQQLRVQQRYRKRRLRLFFYADYATQISKFLQRTNAYNTRSTSNTTADLLLSLKAIPAKCILPFQIYPSSTSLSWYDQTTLSEYCICVADTTNMKMILSESIGSSIYEGQLTRVRFDTPDSKIELALVPGGEETATTTSSTKQQDGSCSIMLTMDTLNEARERTSISAKSVDDNSECRLKQVYEEWQQKYKRQQKEEEAAAVMKEIPIRMEDKTEQIKNRKGSSTNQSESIEMDIVDKADADATPLDKNTTTSLPASAYQNSEHAASEIETTAVATASSAPLHSENATDNATAGETNEQCVQQEAGNRGDENGDNSGDKLSSMSSKRSLPSSTNNETSPSAIRITSTKRHRMAKTATEYLKLNELGSHVTEKGKTAATVNIFGVVLGFGCPRFTRSGDWMMTVWVVDESIPLPWKVANLEGTNVDPAHDHSIPSVSINIFVKERGQLPDLLVAGDVLRCHRLGVQMWNDEIQCLGRRHSSFVVIRPKANAIPEEIEAASGTIQEDAWSVISTATRSFTFDPEDLSRSTLLWRWGQTRLAQHPTIKISTKFRLADMKRQWETDSAEEAIEHGDLTVMVAAKIQVPNEMRTGVTPRGYLRVWDGTGPPQSDPLPIDTGEAHDSVTNGDPPSEALASIASAIRSINGAITMEDRARLAQSSEMFELEPPKAVCGRVVNVAVWEDPSWDLVDASVRIGGFIRLRNVEDRTMASGFRCLMAYNRSSLTPLPDTTFEIRTLLEEHQMRIRQKEPFNRRSGLLPLQSEGRPTDNSNGVNGGITLPFRNPKFNKTSHVSRQGKSTLAHCIAESAGQAFSVSFQIIKTEPSVAGSEIGLRSLCTQSKGVGNSAAAESFQFALHIADDTAKLAVIVDNEIGEFLLGMTASEALNSSDLATDMLDVVTRRDASWSGTVRSVMFRGFKYFTLESISSFPINHSSW